MTGPFFYSPHIQATAMRKQLWKAGFRPVPVLSWTEDADGAGKRPKGFAWPETARLDPPEAACNPAEFDALNTGLLCDGLQAIDIDIDNLELVDQLRSAAIEILGSAPVRRRYNSPRCLLLYRAADGSPKKKTYASVFGKIEILGHGQQFVAFGQHPSGALYTWAPEAPGEFLITEVPTVTLDQIHSFLDKSATILGADDKFGGDQSSPLSSPLGLQASIEVVELSTVGPSKRRSSRLGLVEQDWHGHLGSDQRRRSWLSGLARMVCQARHLRRERVREAVEALRAIAPGIGGSRDSDLPRAKGLP